MESYLNSWFMRIVGYKKNHMVSRALLNCKVKDDRDYSMVILLLNTLQVRRINKRSCHPASARQLQYSK